MISSAVSSDGAKEALPSPVNHPWRHLPHDHFHHGEMFQIIVRLEQGISCEELDKDAADGEEIAGVRPR